MLLRYYSRIADYEATRIQGGPTNVDLPDDAVALARMTGSLRETSKLGSMSQRVTIESLASQLGLPLEMEVSQVFQESKAQSELRRQQLSGPNRRGPRGSGRRGPRNSARTELQKEIVDSWPDLKNPTDWDDLDWLEGGQGDAILAEMRQLPSFEIFNKSQEDRRLSREKATEVELREVQFRRLVHTMESIVLAHNLPRIASSDVQERYQAMLKIESTFLGK